MTCNSILVVEDDEDIRETLKEILEIEGFTVSTASHGKEALAFLAEHKQPCLILLDLMMPVMNGWEFLEVLKINHQHVLATIPVVVVSAVADLERVQEQYGCQILKKPVDLRALVTLAQEYCHSR